MEAAEQEPLMFDDVAIYFTPEEWGSLEEWQKELYKEVMVENYHMLWSLGIPMVKSELLLLIEDGEEPFVQGQPRWEKLGCEPRAAPDGRSQRAEEGTFDRVWRDQRPLIYNRRVVRKRCGRRSPNFSRLELQCFVSLMDRYLPDDLQRAGAISLRQRRSILQEIARCLEPMSGCLRTPRQLLHRWADFNNRDPERLMEIRMQLHYAASGDQSWESSDVKTAPSVGKRWRRRTSHHLSSSSSTLEEVEETLEEPLGSVWDEGLSESSSSPVRPPLQTTLTTHIDAQGRYVVPSPLPGSGLRMIKSEAESEEDEGGGSWSSDVPSPESRQRYRSKVSEGESSECPSPSLVSPEDCYPLSEPPDRDAQGAGSIKRSPNFSPAELECFVALMDHFLPDNLIRAGAIPIRQRKAILQEIARRLEPLSGCLRTPRQLRHRWTDFNNRDADRLEEIRSRLRRAARQESCKTPSKVVEMGSAAGNKWRHRRSQRLQRKIKKAEQDRPEEEQTPEQDHPEDEQTTKQDGPEDEQTPEQDRPEEEQTPKQDDPEEEQTPEQDRPEEEQTPKQDDPEEEQTPEQDGPEEEQTPEQDDPEVEQTPEQDHPEEHRPRTPWHHHGLPKTRNSFSMVR